MPGLNIIHFRKRNGVSISHFGSDEMNIGFFIKKNNIKYKSIDRAQSFLFSILQGVQVEFTKISACFWRIRRKSGTMRLIIVRANTEDH